MQIPGDTQLNTKSVEGFISSVVNKYVVRPTGSPNMIGAGGFLFDVLAKEEVHLEAEITDHFTENNYAIQDHIAIRPVRFTLRGYASELTNVYQQPLLGILEKAQSLGDVFGLAPNFSAQATQAYAKITNVTSKINGVINQANNIFDIFSSKSTTATNQQKAFKFFKSLWETAQLVSVETPYEVFTNMAIERVTAIQNDDTRLITDFSVTFKQFRTVTTVYELMLPNAPLLSGRSAYAGAAVVANGQISGKPVDMTPAAVLKTFYPGNN